MMKNIAALALLMAVMGVVHFALTKAEPVVVDITGFGPTDTVYVNAANDPRSK